MKTSKNTPGSSPGMSIVLAMAFAAVVAVSLMLSAVVHPPITLPSLGLAVVLTLLAALFGYWLGHHLAAPLTQLSATATRIAAGERTAKAYAGGVSEVSRLATAFNAATEELGKAADDAQARTTESNTA